MTAEKDNSETSTAPSRAEASRRWQRWVVPVALLFILSLGLWVRLSQQDHFTENPRFWGVTGCHLAFSRAIAEGTFFRMSSSDVIAAVEFLKRDDAYHASLSEYDEAAVAALGDKEQRYHPYILDQGGWGAFVFLARLLPGVDSIAGVCNVQLFFDLLALLLLFPIVRFVTNSRWLALLSCALYALYFPQAYAAIEPFREGWPTLGAIFSTALMLPAWKQGPAAFPRTAGWMAAAGVVCGLLTYGRSTVVVLPIALSVITFLCWRKPWRSAVAGATVVAAMLVVLSPWMIFVHNTSGFVSLTSSGSGHSLLTGFGEDHSENPTGVLFDDSFTTNYVREVCGYDVPYGSYEYSVACKTEARRFVSDHTRWYRSLLWDRLCTTVVSQGIAHWGIVPQGSLRKNLDWIVHSLGGIGLLLGLLLFRRAWIPLVWVGVFWGFILPFQSHPRLLLGADWALLVGLAMLIGSPWVIGQWILRKLRPRVASPDTDASPDSSSVEPGSPWPFRITSVLVFGVNLTVLALLKTCGPTAPPPENDWRLRMSDANPEIRLSTLDESLRYGVSARPLFVAGLDDPDERVRNAARNAILAFDRSTSVLTRETDATLERELLNTVLVRRYDFSDGKIPAGLRFAPGVVAKVVSDATAEGGSFLRVTLPEGRPEKLVEYTWSRENGKRYIVRLGVRGDDPVKLAFAVDESDKVATNRPVAKTVKAIASHGVPTAFRPATFSFDPEAGENVQLSIRRPTPEGAAPGPSKKGETSMLPLPESRLDLDWLEIRQQKD